MGAIPFLLFGVIPPRLPPPNQRSHSRRMGPKPRCRMVGAVLIGSQRFVHHRVPRIGRIDSRRQDYSTI